jgi:hypothetical protein
MLQTNNVQSHGLLDNQVITGLAPRGFGCGKAALRFLVREPPGAPHLLGGKSLSIVSNCRCV